MTDVLYIKSTRRKSSTLKNCHIAIGITKDGDREIIGFMIQSGESEETWTTEKERGLQGTELVISDAHRLVSAIRKSFTNVSWQKMPSSLLKYLYHHSKKFKIFRKLLKEF